MNIEPYNFFFHPFHEDHSSCTTAASLIVNLTLSVFTCGIYLAVFFGVRTYYACPGSEERSQEGAMGGRDVKKIIEFKADPSSPLSEKAQRVKTKQADHLKKLEAFATRGEWEHLGTHTSHPDSGFDWWMFPTTRPSRGQGDRYALSEEDVVQLSADPEFIRSFRKGVKLVSKSWGWNLESGVDETNSKQKWRGWGVRLGKLLDSLHRFKQKDLHDAIVPFLIQHLNMTSLPGWIQRAALPVQA